MMEGHVLSRAQQSLRPELFARITEKFAFDRLSYDVQRKIAKLHVTRELAFLRGNGFNVRMTDAVISFVMQHGFHPRLDARSLRDGIAEATLAEIDGSVTEFVVCGNALLISPMLDV